MKKTVKTLLFFVCVILSLFIFVLCAGAMTDDGKIVIVLDPGHGGKETGTCAASQPEYVYNLKVAQYVKELLDKNGNFQTVLTRQNNTTSISLLERAIFADKLNADLTLSIHFDGNPSPSLKGASTFVSAVPKFRKTELAENIANNIDKKTGMGIFKNAWQEKDKGDVLYYWNEKLQWSFPDMPEMGYLRDYYGIIKWNATYGIPAIIVEHGFMTNTENLAKIEQDSTLRKLAEADAEAVIDYFTKHEHTFSREKLEDYPSNCTLTGKKSYKCTICGARKDTEYIKENPTGHYMIKNKTIYPTCTKEGYIEYLCEYTNQMNTVNEGICPLHTERETLAATGHTYKLISETPAGHGFDGKKTYRCIMCGDSYSEVIRGEEHKLQFVSESKETCTKDGYKIYICEICKQEVKEVTQKATGHVRINEIYTDATCTQAGRETYDCALCGEHVDRVTEPKGHDFEIMYASEANCIQKSEVAYLCTVCGEEHIEYGEEYGGHVIGKMNGKYSYTCQLCGEEIQIEKRQPIKRNSDAEEPESPNQEKEIKRLRIGLWLFLTVVVSTASGFVIVEIEDAVNERKAEKAFTPPPEEVPQPEEKEKEKTGEKQEEKV